MVVKSVMRGAVNSLEEGRALYHFSGRTAVVTGGTGVLGAVMARALAGCNANVVLVGRKVERAQALIGSFAGSGRHLAIAADVLDRPALEEARRRVVAEHGQVDILVTGAGAQDP